MMIAAEGSTNPDRTRMTETQVLLVSLLRNEREKRHDDGKEHLSSSCIQFQKGKKEKTGTLLVRKRSQPDSSPGLTINIPTSFLSFLLQKLSDTRPKNQEADKAMFKEREREKKKK